MFASLFTFLLFVLLTVPAKILYLHLANNTVLRLLFHFLMSKLLSNIPLMFSKIMSPAKSVGIFILWDVNENIEDSGVNRAPVQTQLICTSLLLNNCMCSLFKITMKPVSFW